MTNFEKFKDEIIDLLKNKQFFSVVEGQPKRCMDTDCDTCLFHGLACGSERILWLYGEYHEPIKLTAKEKAFLSIVETGWIARDQGGDLYWYLNKPKRQLIDFEACDSKGFFISSYLNLFNYVKWKDEPYSVEEMLTWEVESDKF